MPKLDLSKEQMRLVHKALETQQRDLKQGMQQPKATETWRESAHSELFQLELLITWFDRQREMET